MIKKGARSSVFQFKKFQVDQSHCAMKINTDGVILGAWSGLPGPSDASISIVDIGTGTGVVALMLAQRFPRAQVIAVEVDPQAAGQASVNFQNSPYKERISIRPAAFQEIKEENGLPLNSVDLIVSNPPFFLNSLQNADVRKSLARHTDLSFFSDLLVWASQYVRQKGFLQLIIPPDLVIKIQNELLETTAWQIYATYWIYSFSNDEKAVRCLLTLQLHAEIVQVLEENLVIYDEPKKYSEAYKSLLSQFLLDF